MNVETVETAGITAAAPGGPGPQDTPPMLAPHETWLALNAFVAVLALALSGLSVVKIINSGGKVLQAVALGLALVALVGVAALTASMSRATAETTEDGS